VQALEHKFGAPSRAVNQVREKRTARLRAKADRPTRASCRLEVCLGALGAALNGSAWRPISFGTDGATSPEPVPSPLTAPLSMISRNCEHVIGLSTRVPESPSNSAHRTIPMMLSPCSSRVCKAVTLHRKACAVHTLSGAEANERDWLGRLSSHFTR